VDPGGRLLGYITLDETDLIYIFVFGSEYDTENSYKPAGGTKMVKGF
jgi:hypothetical protein